MKDWVLKPILAAMVMELHCYRITESWLQSRMDRIESTYRYMHYCKVALECAGKI